MKKKFVFSLLSEAEIRLIKIICNFSEMQPTFSSQNKLKLLFVCLSRQ